MFELSFVAVLGVQWLYLSIQVVYRLKLDPPTSLEHVFDQIDSAADAVCPSLAVVAISGGLLYCSCKYGELCMRVVSNIERGWLDD